jgi:hypothetical protein
LRCAKSPCLEAILPQLKGSDNIVDVAIGKFGSRSFFQMNGKSIEIKDYKISTSMHGRTELEIVFEFEGDFTEFLSKVNSTDGKS